MKSKLFTVCALCVSGVYGQSPISRGSQPVTPTEYADSAIAFDFDGAGLLRGDERLLSPLPGGVALYLL